MRKFLCLSLFFLLCGSASMAAIQSGPPAQTGGSATGEIAVTVTVLPIHKADDKGWQPPARATDVASTNAAPVIPRDIHRDSANGNMQ